MLQLLLAITLGAAGFGERRRTLEFIKIRIKNRPKKKKKHKKKTNKRM